MKQFCNLIACATLVLAGFNVRSEEVHEPHWTRQELEAADRAYDNEATDDDIKADLDARKKLGTDDDAQGDTRHGSQSHGSEGGELKIEVYKGSPVVKHQFVTATLNGQIKYVFAVSTGRAGHSTPSGGPFGIQRMLRSHNSTTYPGRTNNMDFAVFFRERIALHATTRDAYPNLGHAASHGCVRQARPNAEALFNLVNQVGRENTWVTVYSEGANPPSESVSFIIDELNKNLNFIHSLFAKVAANFLFKDLIASL